MRFLLIFCLCLVSFGAGVSVIHLKIFPYGLLRAAVNEFDKPFGVPEESSNAELSVPVDIEDVDGRLMRVLDKAADFRSALKQRVVLPKEIVSLGKTEVSPTNYEIIETKGSHAHYEIKAQFYGIKVNGIIIKSERDEPKCLDIYVQGHLGNPFDFDYHEKILDWSLSRGCDFLSLSMLGLGLNRGSAEFPRYDMSIKLPESSASEHVNYSFYRDIGFPRKDPLSLFLTGHYHIIDRVAGKYEKVSLMGISGGGWYAVWLAALIPDIDNSISYAGSLPLTYRFALDKTKTRSFSPGDWEQTHSSVYDDIGYWELYALMTLSSEGLQSREAFLVYNDSDPCCFADPFASDFKAKIDALSVNMPTVIVTENDKHNMRAELVKNILE